MATPQNVPLVAVRRPLGSRFLLIFFRAFQLIWAISVLLILCDAFPPTADAFTKFLVASMVIFLSIGFHPYAYGYADEAGVTFRRYFRKHFVAWDQIRDARWGGWDFAKLVIVTAHPVQGSRRLYFAYLGGTWQAFRRRWTPEPASWVIHRVKAGR